MLTSASSGRCVFALFFFFVSGHLATYRRTPRTSTTPISRQRQTPPPTHPLTRCCRPPSWTIFPHDGALPPRQLDSPLLLHRLRQALHIPADDLSQSCNPPWGPIPMVASRRLSHLVRCQICLMRFWPCSVFFVSALPVNCISLSFYQHCSCAPAQIVRTPYNVVTSASSQIFSKRAIHGT